MLQSNTSRTGTGRWSLRSQLIICFVGISVLSVVIAAVSLKALSSFGSKPAQQSAIARQLSTLADGISNDTLQCRRYEKDMFLNLDNPLTLSKYHAKWMLKVERLAKDVGHLGVLARSIEQDHVELDIPRWNQLIKNYRHAVDEVYEGIESGEIDHPSQANLAMTPHKPDIRSLTIMATEQGLARRQQAGIWDQRMLAGVAHVQWVIGAMVVLVILVGGTLSFRANAIATQAEFASKAKSAFLANMSHEIRTPMTAILGFADRLYESGDLSQAPPDRVESIETIRRNGDHLLTIINDILDLSKIEAGKLEVEQTQCSIVQIVAEVQSLMRVRAQSKGLSLEIEYLGNIPETITTDPTRLKQILMNLIGNAIKFTPSGFVRMSVGFERRMGKPILVFDVIDSGIGMTRTQANSLFNSFTQANSSITRKFGGTGLGLTISKQLAQMLGGSISIEHCAPSKGSTFRLNITTGSIDGVRMLDEPMRATAIKPRASKALAEGFDLSGVHILLAEDGVDNQRLISLILGKYGAQISIVENGQLAHQSAMEALEKGKPFDVILMDMQMPVMDGYEATRKLRKDGYSGVIIALTAHAMESDRMKCLHTGCDDFANKPINRSALMNMIINHVRSRQAPVQGTDLGTDHGADAA